MKRLSGYNSANAHGFSFVELLVVCSISLILLSIAIPNIQRTLMSYRLESTSTLLSSRLREAKLTAVKYNRTASLRVNNVNRTFEVWSTTPAGTAMVSPPVGIPNGITIDSTSAMQVNFNSLGRNNSTSSVIKMSLPGSSFCKSITTSDVGNVVVTAGC